MGITIRFSKKPKRKPYNPKAGDKKVVKGVEYVRVRRMYQGCYCVSNGRPLYDWVRVDEAEQHDSTDN